MSIPSSRTLIVKGGIILTGSSQCVADVAIVNGMITEVGPGLSGDDTLDASGCVVCPGFVDLHTHLREPGREDTETIETGSRAGALGGYTALVAMPNTDPAQDSVAVVEFVRGQSPSSAFNPASPRRSSSDKRGSVWCVLGSAAAGRV